MGENKGYVRLRLSGRCAEQGGCLGKCVSCVGGMWVNINDIWVTCSLRYGQVNTALKLCGGKRRLSGGYRSLRWGCVRIHKFCGTIRSLDFFKILSLVKYSLMAMKSA